MKDSRVFDTSQAKKIFHRIRLTAVALVFIGSVGALAAIPFGTWMYGNRDRLPAFAANRVHPDLYSLQDHFPEFLSWGLWPGGLLVLSGVVLFGASMTSDPIRERILRDPGRYVVWIIAAAGITLRLRAYFAERSLWLDESFLALNFRERGLIDLLVMPLENGQSAPPGFLVLVFAATATFGFGELALRLVPLLFGIAAVVLSVPVARALLFSRVAEVIFVGLVAVSPVMVYYAAELKQYSTDAFVTILILWLLVRWRQGLSTWMIGFIGLVATQLSVTSVFSLSALGLVMLIGAGKDKVQNRFRAFTKIIPAYGLWFVGGLLHLGYLLVGGVDRDVMRNWWGDNGGYPPARISVESFEWFFVALRQLIWLSVGHPGRAGPGMGTGPLYVFILASALIIAGVLLAYRRYLFPLSLIVIAVLVSVAGLYPFSSRLNIYLIPVVLLAFAISSDAIMRTGSRAVRGLAIGSTIGLALIPVALALAYFGKPITNWDTRWLISEVEAKARAGDILIAPDSHLIEWYAPEGIGSEVLMVSVDQLPDLFDQETRSDVWAISTHFGFSGIAESLPEEYSLACNFEVNGSFFARWVHESLLPIDPGACKPVVPKF